jgi:fused signal recognition particle receptor
VDPNLSFEEIYFGLGLLALVLGLWTLRKKTKKAAPAVQAPITAHRAENNWWAALSKTRDRLLGLQNKATIEGLKGHFEEAFLVADLGVKNTQEALDRVNWPEIIALPEERRMNEAQKQLAQAIQPWMAQASTSSDAWIAPLDTGDPKVIWFVGVNGVGKTTSIAKLAAELLGKGQTVLLAAGDTFRAAAGEQLEIWADRLKVPIVKGQPGADSSSVLFDAIQSAKSKKIQFVLCDSAGRLHNQSQLMEALQKNRRVIEKAQAGAPHEVLLVIDAHTGQNMLNQAESFMSAVGVTGLVLTKLDGTARGGAVVAVARKTGLPLRRLGLGERPQDFVNFDAQAFSNALLGVNQ